MKKFYAHSIEEKPVDEWHRFEEHKGLSRIYGLRVSGVPAKGAGSESGLSPAKRSVTQFAAEFGCGEWGGLAGW